MAETKQNLRKSTLDLVDDAKESYLHFQMEVEEAFDLQRELKERKGVLGVAVHKTRSGMAQTIIRSMIDELDEEIEKQKEREIHGERNKKYYDEVRRAIEEAVKEF